MASPTIERERAVDATMLDALARTRRRGVRRTVLVMGAIAAAIFALSLLQMVR